MTKTVMLHAQQKWEYMELTRKTESYLLSEINEFGQHGWELVSVTHGKDLKGELNWTAFLKRPYAAQGHPQQNNHHAESRVLGDQVTVQPAAATANAGAKLSAAADDADDELRFREE